MFRSCSLTLVSSVTILLSAAPEAQLGPGTVARLQKISHTQGGRGPRLDDSDQLGRAVTNLGDLDGDGVIDLATAGHTDDDGGLDQGAAYILFMRLDGMVRETRKISELEGGFTGRLDEGDQFGRALAGIGDLDADGVPDLAVGANFDDDGGMNRGAVWLLCLNRDGTVKRTSKISSTSGGFAGPLFNQDEFGRSLCSPGDLDGDGVPELAVGSPTDNTGGTRRGAVWILFLRQDGSVKRAQKIAFGVGGFTGRLRSLDWFGFSLAPLGDFDRDGVRDLLVGAALDDDGALNAGAVWLLFLRPDGTVKGHQKISMLSGGFTALLETVDQFGTSVATLGDVNGDGITDIAAGAVKDADGGRENGAVYVLFLTPTGTVAAHQKISDTEGGFPVALDDWDWLGSSLAPLGDLNRDGIPDLAVGARNDDDGGPNRGAVYITLLRGAQALMAGGPRLGEPMSQAGQESLDRTSTADNTTGSWMAVHGRHAEPEGSLELVSTELRPGATLVFRLHVPEAMAADGARAELCVSRALTEPLFAERTGILVDPGQVVHSRRATALPGRREIEISLRLPDDPTLIGETLAFQARWQGKAGNASSDALQLCLE
ncbi:MAG: hypothetical protein HOP15_02825 [Planctomycetes bacterium]|nr:hypothetical protein [Planctomycetota bacterium]